MTHSRIAATPTPITIQSQTGAPVEATTGTTSVSVSPQFWQVSTFSPVSFFVGSLVTIPSSQSWPSAGTVSVLVSVQPLFMQEIVFTPSSVQVGSVVIFPLSHL